MGSRGIGIQWSDWDKKFSQTSRSFLLFELREMGLDLRASAKDAFKLNLNVFRNGHIEEMKLSLLATDCICNVDTMGALRRFTISDIVFLLLSSGRLQDSVRVFLELSLPLSIRKPCRDQGTVLLARCLTNRRYFCRHRRTPCTSSCFWGDDWNVVQLAVDKS